MKGSGTVWRSTRKETARSTASIEMHGGSGHKKRAEIGERREGKLEKSQTNRIVNESKTLPERDSMPKIKQTPPAVEKGGHGEEKTRRIKLRKYFART